MEITIKLSHAELSATNIEGTQVTEVIKGFFQSLGNAPVPAPKTARAFKPEIDVEEIFKEPAKPGEVKVTPSKAWINSEDPEPRVTFQPVDESSFKAHSKRLPLVNLNDSVKEPIGTIGEIAKFARDHFIAKPKEELLPPEPIVNETSDKEPAYWETGIKIRDGVPHYKTHYDCDCGLSGRHYIPKGTETVKCHGCKTRLYVDPASYDFDEDGLPHRDKRGNFYVAREVVSE